MGNAGSNTAADVLKYAAGSGGGAVLGHTLPHTPQPNPIGPQWAAIKGGVGGTCFGDFGSMQTWHKEGAGERRDPGGAAAGMPDGSRIPAGRRRRRGHPYGISSTRHACRCGRDPERVPASAAICRRPHSGPARSRLGRPDGTGRVVKHMIIVWAMPQGGGSYPFHYPNHYAGLAQAHGVFWIDLHPNLQKRPDSSERSPGAARAYTLHPRAR